MATPPSKVYPGGNQLKVAVSDSGLGIMQTLRPSLEREVPSLAKLSDMQLLAELYFAKGFRGMVMIAAAG